MEDWQNFGRALSQVDGAIHWWIGDDKNAAAGRFLMENQRGDRQRRFYVGHCSVLDMVPAYTHSPPME